MAEIWKGLSRRLEGSVVTLEPLSPHHEEVLFEAARDERIWHWLPRAFEEVNTSGGFHAWFEEALAASRAGVQAAFATLDVGTGGPVGSTRYLTLRPEHLGLEIGWTWLAPSRWKTGANVEAKLLMLEHAFERLGCQRVEFLTDSRNERSRAALEALPAQFEGILRKHRFAPRLRDSACYSIVDDEWSAVRANLERRLRGRL